MSQTELGDDQPIELAPIPGLEDSIFGYGINCITGVASLTNCFKSIGELGRVSAPGQSSQYSVVRNSSSYASFMSAAASMSASGLSWSASASVSYARTQMSSDTYVSYAATKNMRSQNIQIDRTKAEVSPDAIAMIKDPARGPAAFLAAYGTHCVYGVAYGGSFIGRIRFEARSSYDKDSIAASMSGSIQAFGGGGSINAQFQQEMTRITNSYELNGNFSMVGSITSQFGNNDPDGLIAACRDMKLDHDKQRDIDGAAVAFLCVTWDRIPAIAKALQEIGQPKAFDFSTSVGNITVLSAEYASLQFIIGTCQSLLRSHDFAIPSYGGVLQTILNAAAGGQQRIQALTIQQIVALTPQTIAPYLISSQMTALLDAISHGQVLLRLNYLADGAFEGGGEFSMTAAKTFTPDEQLVATFYHSPDRGRGRQQIWYYFHLRKTDQGMTLQTHIKWHDPDGPGSGDWFGAAVNLGTPDFPRQVSDAKWEAWPWNHVAAQLVGFDQASLYGWS